MNIQDIKSLEVLDSRGKPTVRTFVYLDDGSYGVSSVPSGASTGSHEAVELRDGDKLRHLGQGTLTAVANVNEILKKTLVGLEADPGTIDEKMIAVDATENKAKLGANAILSVSQALLKALANSKKLPLWKIINEYYFKDKKPNFPRLMVNVVNGGKHAGWNFDIQEFMIVPVSNQPSVSVRTAAEIFQQLGKSLKAKGLSTLVGDEGGYSPALHSNEEVFEVIVNAAKEYGYTNGEEYQLAIDAAATEFYTNGKYILKKTNQIISGEELINFYLGLQKKYSILSFEDPFAEDDWVDFTNFTGSLNGESIVVGDDLYVTNTKRIEKGIKEKATNAVLIKPNQIGTVMETAAAINMTKKAGWKVVISHRSGETEDSFIADLSYGSGADFIKTGSTSRSERLAKYNRLLEIENNL